MRPGKRFGLSAIEKSDVWRRWKAGESLHDIGRAFGKEHSCIRSVLLPRGGIAPINTERGIVIGYAILYYGNSDRRMQINEIFKILDGRIRLIDNIGLMEEGITTSGFTN